MGTTWEGDSDNRKPNLKLDGKKIIVEKIGVYDGAIKMCYTKEVIYHFDTEELAMEYYYKNK
jgi:hypothetical protein